MDGVDKLILKIDEIMEQNRRIYQLLESMKKPVYNNTNNYQPKEVDRGESTEYKNTRNVYIKNLMKKSLKNLNNQVWISTKSSILKIPRNMFNH